jgi:flagellar biosynthesis chaperone FliJ
MANIKQIENFKSKYLRMAGFVEYVQQVLKLFKDFRDSGEEGQSQLPNKVEPVYTSFKDSVTAVDDAYKLSRASEYTQKIADEDDRRDNLYRQLVNLLKMYSRFGYDTEKKEAADYLWNIVKKYNVDPAENYSEESGKLQQMIQELTTDAQAELRTAKLGIENLITQLNTANEQVRTLMGYRNDERMQIEKAALATARENADQAYRDLILALNASAVMDDDAHRFDELISQVNELIKYYRMYVLPKAGKKDEESEENGSSTGSETAGNGGSSEGSGSESGSGGDDTDQ